MTHPSSARNLTRIGRAGPATHQLLGLVEKASTNRNPVRDAIRRLWKNIASCSATNGPLPDQELHALSVDDRTDRPAVERAWALVTAAEARCGDLPVLCGFRVCLTILTALIDDLRERAARDTQTDASGINIHVETSAPEETSTPELELIPLSAG